MASKLGELVMWAKGRLADISVSADIVLIRYYGSPSVQGATPEKGALEKSFGIRYMVDADNFQINLLMPMSLKNSSIEKQKEFLEETFRRISEHRLKMTANLKVIEGGKSPKKKKTKLHAI